MAIPLVLDVDTGIDDALAILFALKHPEIRLLAITCVAGNAPLNQVIDNTMKVLDIASAPEIPVAGGAQQPIVEPPHGAGHVHGSDGMADLELPDSHRKPVPQHAIELLRDLLSQSPVPITVVGLAPLTNIALLLRTYPECAPNIARIVIMGGAVGTGNATASAEFNIWHDPEAAQIVLNSGVPVTMYTLDAFETVQVSPEVASRWAVSEDPVASFVGQLIMHPRSEPDGRKGDPFGLLGDAGAVCAVVAPHLMECKPYPVFIELAPGSSRGQSHVDRRTQTGEDDIHSLKTQWPVATVILSVDGSKIIDLYTQTLGLEVAAS